MQQTKVKRWTAKRSGPAMTVKAVMEDGVVMTLAGIAKIEFGEDGKVVITGVGGSPMELVKV